MKILKRGELPTKKVYRTTCHVCKTEFEFTRYEKGVRDVFDQRDGNAVVAICPLPNCGNDCWVTM